MKTQKKMVTLGGKKAVGITLKKEVWKKLSKLHIDRDEDDNLSDTVEWLLTLVPDKYKNV